MEAALATKTPLYPRHLAIIPLMIIAKKVQQAVQGEYPQLDLHRVASPARLPAGHATRDDHVAKLPGLISGKRQHVGAPVFAQVAGIQCADPSIGCQRDRHGAAGTCGGDRLEPTRQAKRPKTARRDHLDMKTRPLPTWWTAAPQHLTARSGHLRAHYSRTRRKP